MNVLHLVVPPHSGPETWAAAVKFSLQFHTISIVDDPKAKISDCILNEPDSEK